MMKHMPDTFKAVYPKDAKCKKNVQNDNTIFAHFVTLFVCMRAFAHRLQSRSNEQLTPFDRE